jgi:hypothetical protein
MRERNGIERKTEAAPAMLCTFRGKIISPETMPELPLLKRINNYNYYERNSKMFDFHNHK